MNAERTEQVIEPVHVTKAEAAAAVASGVLVAVGIVAAAPLVAVGGGLIGIGMGLHVRDRESFEKDATKRIQKTGGRGNSRQVK